jgi:hypothetical protein
MIEMKNDRPTQLGLFVEPGQEEALIEPAYDSINAHQETNSIVDIEALRVQLLTWGAKHRYPCFGFPYTFPPTGAVDRRYGGLPHGLQGWKREMAHPSQQDRYPGEWLTKVIEQIKRYDLGVYDIPEQISHIADDRE